MAMTRREAIEVFKAIPPDRWGAVADRIIAASLAGEYKPITPLRECAGCHRHLQPEASGHAIFHSDSCKVQAFKAAAKERQAS